MRALVLLVDPRRGTTDGRREEGYDDPEAPSNGSARNQRQVRQESIVTDADRATAVLLDLLRQRRWHVGVGLGELADGSGAPPIGGGADADADPARAAAAEALARAHSVPSRIAVDGDPAGVVGRLEAVLWLTASLLNRRTERGWEVADLLAEGLTHQQVGDRLGISQSAVSQRARAAGVVESQRAADLVRELVDEALRGPS